MNWQNIFKRRVWIGLSLFLLLLLVIFNPVALFKDILFYLVYYFFMLLLTVELLNINSNTSNITKKTVYLITHLHLLSYLICRFLMPTFFEAFTLANFIAISASFLVIYLFVIYFFYILNYKKKMGNQNNKVLNDIGYGLIVLFYILYLIHHVCYLREIKFLLNISTPIFIGNFYLIYLILISSSYDVGAYFLGKSFGKGNKLGLLVSPKKSWAGIAGGIFLSFTMFCLMHLLCLWLNFTSYQQTFFYKMPLGWVITFTIFLAFLSQFGDLSASLHKRILGVKNSSKVLAGHGGIYDRADSTIWITWLGFYVFYLYHLFN